MEIGWHRLQALLTYSFDDQYTDLVIGHGSVEWRPRARLDDWLGNGWNVAIDLMSGQIARSRWIGAVISKQILASIGEIWAWKRLRRPGCLLRSRAQPGRLKDKTLRGRRGY